MSEQPVEVSRQALIDVVSASPLAVAKHDKAAWLDLFCAGARVEDPVGTPPHIKGLSTRRSSTGDDDLGCFYESFIANNDVRFVVRRDIVVGNEVVRDVVIHIRMSHGVTVLVPAHLLYRVTAESGRLEIASMSAHWNARWMSSDVMRAGWSGVLASMSASAAIWRHQGFLPLIRYTRGILRGIGARGTPVVRSFCAAVREGRAEDLALLFGGGEARIEFPAGTTLDARSFFEALGGPGEFRVSALRASGQVVSALFERFADTTYVRGVAFFDFAPSGVKLERTRFYFEPGN